MKQAVEKFSRKTQAFLSHTLVLLLLSVVLLVAFVSLTSLDQASDINQSEAEKLNVVPNETNQTQSNESVNTTETNQSVNASQYYDNKTKVCWQPNATQCSNQSK
jgi:uncharacterized membrane protein required for colicin V production